MVICYVLQILIHLVESPLEERVEIKIEGRGGSQITQDEVGQRILTALKRVRDLTQLASVVCAGSLMWGSIP